MDHSRAPARTRRALLAGAAGGLAALAGCSALGGGGGRRQPPLVEDRPDGVYVPSHVEGMDSIGMQTAGDVGVALSFTYPHRFWLVSGTDTRRVEVESSDAVHLMAVVWDRETGVRVGSAAPRVTVRGSEDGEQVANRTLWPMLSQPMGLHYGGNLPLDGGGGYEVRLDVPAPTSPRLRGPAHAEGLRTVEFGFEFSTSRLNLIGVRTLDDRQGDRGAVEPMDMEMLPSPRAPARDALPGRDRGRATSGDAVFLARVLSPERAGTDDPYLAVSARTRYNRFPLPGASLTAVPDGGEPVDLTPALDPDLGYHYGAPVPDAGSRSHALRVDAPPQVTRHEGYETAFFDLGPVTVP